MTPRGPAAAEVVVVGLDVQGHAEVSGEPLLRCLNIGVMFPLV